MRRRIATMFDVNSDLPAGCRHVRYLQGNGSGDTNSGYIDTGILPSSKSGNELEVEASYNGEAVWGVLFGCSSDVSSAGTGYKRWYLINYDTNKKLRLITSSGDIYFTVSEIDQKKKYKLVGNVLSVDGVEVATGAGQNDLYRNIAIFARIEPNYSIAGCSPWRVYSFVYTRNGVKLIDLIPIVHRENGSDTPYMYDKVTRAYLPFGNKGSGTFGWEELDGTVVSPT